MLTFNDMQNRLMVQAVPFGKVKSLTIRLARLNHFWAECDPIRNRIALRGELGRAARRAMTSEEKTLVPCAA